MLIILVKRFYPLKITLVMYNIWLALTAKQLPYNLYFNTRTTKIYDHNLEFTDTVSYRILLHITYNIYQTIF